MGGMLPEHLEKYFCPTDYSASDTAVANGTVYFTASEQVDAYCNTSLLDKIYFDVDDTAGTGTNTYTIEATLDGGTTWRDLTNEWFGVANFTADFSKSPAFPCPVDDVRIKLVRSGDPAPGDGAYAVRIRRRRWGI